MTKWTRKHVMAPCGLNDPAAPRHIAKVTRNPNPIGTQPKPRRSAQNLTLTSRLRLTKPELTLTTSPRAYSAAA